MKKPSNKRPQPSKIVPVVEQERASSAVDVPIKYALIALNVRRSVSFTLRGELVTLSEHRTRVYAQKSDLTPEINDKVKSGELTLHW